MSDDVLELQVWKGDWGLPSVDPNCLAVLVRTAVLYCILDHFYNNLELLSQCFHIFASLTFNSSSESAVSYTVIGLIGTDLQVPC